MGERFLFRHILQGVTMTIFSTHLDGAKSILEKLVFRAEDWTHYK